MHQIPFSHDENSMDYSSQDSNPIDFSKNKKDLVPSHCNSNHIPEEDIDRRCISNVSIQYRMIHQISIFYFILYFEFNQKIQDENNNGENRRYLDDSINQIQIENPISPVPVQASAMYLQNLSTKTMPFTPIKQRLKYENSQTICAINDAYLSTIEKTMKAAAAIRNMDSTGQISNAAALSPMASGSGTCVALATATAMVSF